MEEPTGLVNPQKWLELYGDILYQYTLPRVNDAVVAEDLVQDTFLSALRGLAGFEGRASEKNWLFSILKNKIIDHYRKKAAENKTLTLSELPDPGGDWFDEGGSWMENRRPQNWQAADTPMERKEFQKIINWCKDHLKTLQQQVFTLKYLEGLESEEICKVLAISASNYWVILHRVRLQMRACVEKKWLN